MCTLIVLHRCLPDRPLVVAANRDEFLDRPAEGPAVRNTRGGPILAPLDLEAGGTWVGLSARGVFAGLTNLRATSEQGATGLRSRGEVVMAALESPSAEAAIRTLSALEEETYNPFQLLVADGRDAWLLVYRGRPEAIELEPGAHIVGNVEDASIAALLESRAPAVEAMPEPLTGFEGVEGLIDSEAPRVMKLTRIRERVEKLMTEPGRDLFDGLARICREHVVDPSGATGDRLDGMHDRTSAGESAGTGRGNDMIVRPVDDPGEGRREVSPFESTCVHVADRYGTRSSLLLELTTDPDASRLWTTDGPPCEQSFENRSSLLRELGVRLSA